MDRAYRCQHLTPPLIEKQTVWIILEAVGLLLKLEFVFALSFLLHKKSTFSRSSAALKIARFALGRNLLTSVHVMSTRIPPLFSRGSSGWSSSPLLTTLEHSKHGLIPVGPLQVKSSLQRLLVSYYNLTPCVNHESLISNGGMDTRL